MSAANPPYAHHGRVSHNASLSSSPWTEQDAWDDPTPPYRPNWRDRRDMAARRAREAKTETDEQEEK